MNFFSGIACPPCHPIKDVKVCTKNENTKYEHVRPTRHCSEYKKLSYRRGTARRAVTVKTVLNVAKMFVELHLISPALSE